MVSFKAGLLDQFKDKEFSEPGSTSFQMEQATYSSFCKTLREMESLGNDYCSLNNKIVTLATRMCEW